MTASRKKTITRKTKETDIKLTLDLDQSVNGEIDTGSPFLDHMLDLFRKHSGMGLSVVCRGDKDIDMHHSTEDIAICLGEAINSTLGDKKNLERYGFYMVPMDEALARVALDLSGRISFKYNVELQSSIIGNFETELVAHFFESLAHNACINLHIDLLRGNNVHHCIEAVFKAFARALSMAVTPNSRIKGVPSTKGLL